jgi:ubiquinone/menaquinone biosynthesis C-methylase UbiE
LSKSFTKLDPSWWIDQGDYFIAHTEFWYEAVYTEDSSYDLVLDLGCGHGRFSLPLAEMSETVISADINPKMLKSLQVRAKKFDVTDKIILIVSDAQLLPFRDYCFDMVNFIGTMVHIPNQKKAIEEMYRIIKEGAKVIVDHTNYLSIRFLWEGFIILFLRAFNVGRNPPQKIFMKRCNLLGFKKMFQEVGMYITKTEGFQIVPFLPLLGLYHDARFHIIPLTIANKFDKLFRRTPLVFFAYNILIIGIK